MAETMAHCRTQGHAVYDLLAPADPYKQVLGTGRVTVTDHAAALGPVGRVGVLLLRSRPHLKQVADRIPPRLRAALLALRRA
jgi:CelD/BcsL family acetyltransferase involved in cellulose biosynthesis